MDPSKPLKISEFLNINLKLNVWKLTDQLPIKLFLHSRKETVRALLLVEIFPNIKTATGLAPSTT